MFLLSKRNFQMFFKFYYFDMLSVDIWFMWSEGRLCLIWPITDGLACNIFLFPQCHSHNPSLRAEPKSCSSNILCLNGFGHSNGCVFTWVHRNINLKNVCNFPCVENMSVHFFICLCSYQAPEIIVKWVRQSELTFDINKGQDPFISHCVFYWHESKLGAELSKLPVHLGVCYKLLGFVFLTLYITFLCTSLWSVLCSLNQYLTYNSDQPLFEFNQSLTLSWRVYGYYFLTVRKCNILRLFSITRGCFSLKRQLVQNRTVIFCLSPVKFHPESH